MRATERDLLEEVNRHEGEITAKEIQRWDTLTGLYGLWLALTTSGAVVVCVSPSQRRSDL